MHGSTPSALVRVSLPWRAMDARNQLCATAALLLALALAVPLLPPAPVAAAPILRVDGFTEESVTADVEQPTALAFTPDGRLLITSRPGRLFVYADEALVTTPALDIIDDTCSNRERGLLGVAVDPNFAINNRIFLYYTFKKFNRCPTDNRDAPVNRVASFVLSDDNKATGEQVLIDNIPSPHGNHNAGDLHVGQDGNLYVSVGDGGCELGARDRCQPENRNARRPYLLNGKILRITPDGDIPPGGNAYTGTDSVRCHVQGRADAGQRCQEIFAAGLRNPFRIAFDPNAADTRFYINDVGGKTWEEIDEGEAGADYGWNVREGPCPTGESRCRTRQPAAFTPPIHDYKHATGCQSITGGAFVPDGAWPAKYENGYLFGDFVCDKLFLLEPGASGGLKRTVFATGLNGPVHLTFGPDGALYYSTLKTGGEVRRIRPPSASQP